MEDLERYGDYNDVTESEKGSKNVAGIIIKILFGVICALVIGILAFRLFSAEYYPKNVKRLLLTPTLTEAFRDGAEPEVFTQKLRFPYDHNKEGTFFCDYLLICPETGDLQITVRYNDSALETIREKTGKEDFTLSFALSDNTAQDETVMTRVYAPVTATAENSFLMYSYKKLAFSGIPLSGEPSDGIPAPEWIRLDTFVDGEYYSSVLIYENNADYSQLKPYSLKKGERP